MTCTGFDDHLGWHEQGDGKWFYGLNIENGRIQDNEQLQLKTALREICRSFEPGHPADVASEHSADRFGPCGDNPRSSRSCGGTGVRLTEEISTVRRWSMACVALPTCGLAITDSERACRASSTNWKSSWRSWGCAGEPFTVRMTGCPNGCARPYNSDIGLVGKAAGKYTMFLGGRLVGDRLNFVYKDLVPAAEIVPTLVPLMVYFRQDRSAGESFGDFCHRKGKDDLTAWAEQYQAGPQ